MGVGGTVGSFFCMERRAFGVGVSFGGGERCMSVGCGRGNDCDWMDVGTRYLRDVGAGADTDLTVQSERGVGTPVGEVDLGHRHRRASDVINYNQSQELHRSADSTIASRSAGYKL